MKKNFFLLSAMLLAASTLLTTSCSENDMPDVPTPTEGETIGFTTYISQDWYADQVPTRASAEQSASMASTSRSALPEPRLIPMECSEGGLVAYLEETSVSGINSAIPVADTRGTPIETVAALGDFSTYCNYSDNNNLYYANIAAGNDGKLKTEKLWPMGKALKFYAVHPYDASSANFTSSASGISYNFTVNETVSAETDLMYAATGSVAWNAERLAPLHFKHALTAIKFAVGTGLNYGATITSITLKNVCTTGTYTLPDAKTTAASDVMGAWSNLGGRRDITLTGLSVTTDDNGGTELTVDPNIFLMIPQDLTDVKAVITMQVDGRTLTLTSSLSGSEKTWQQGHTVTYTLTNTTGSIEYVITASSPEAIAYTATQTGDYGITSYCYYGPSGNPVQKPVGWKVVKYEYSDDNGATWTDNGTEKPVWLTALSRESGDGGTSAQTGKATVDAESYIIDKKKERDDKIKNAEYRGSAAAPYDLSTHNIKGREISKTTANCYVISAPGYYSLPLIYGNAIEGGKVNYKSFTPTISSNPFVDCDGRPLSTYYLQGGALDFIPPMDEVASASLIWSDISEDIASNLQVSNGYLNFEVTKENIEQGNAVVAVKKANGCVVWSWHLWFAPDDVLDPITCRNKQEAYYDFTKETLGMKYTEWKGSTYEVARQIRVTVQQTSGTDPGTGQPKTATFTITQNPGDDYSFITTLYQFGRKDALPGTKTFYPSDGYKINAPGKVNYATSIQNPGTFYPCPDESSLDWCSATFNNAWSANNNVTTANDNKVVKTVYDPCPAGLSMPPSNAFTGFTTTGDNASDVSEFNVIGSWNKGWTFTGQTDFPERRSNVPIFFPASGYRNPTNGNLFFYGSRGYIWTAIPYNAQLGRYLAISPGILFPLSSFHRAYGFAVRPVYVLPDDDA